jgi:hypothetical protein
MNYFIKRDLSEFGPYTLAELQRYTSTGNVLLTDLCRSEGMTDWTPVSEVIGNIPVPVAAPAPPAGAMPAAVSQYPPPPSLHWGVAVLLGIITCGIFGWVWALVQASWMKKVQPASKALMFYGIAIGLMLISVFTGIGQGQQRTVTGISSLFNLAGAIMWIIASFSMRSSIEEHFSSADPMPSAASLSGVMTFFFNVYYFQYHFTKVNEAKQRQGLYR